MSMLLCKRHFSSWTVTTKLTTICTANLRLFAVGCNSDADVKCLCYSRLQWTAFRCRTHPTCLADKRAGVQFPSSPPYNCLKIGDLGLMLRRLFYFFLLRLATDFTGRVLHLVAVGCRCLLHVRAVRSDELSSMGL